MSKKLLKKGKKFIQRLSPSTWHTDQLTIPTAQSTPSLLTPPAARIPHHPRSNISLRMPLMQVDGGAPTPASTSKVSTLPLSAEEPKSKSMKIAKDALKTTLNLLNAALPGLPFKGAFTAAIEVIKIAEVSTCYDC
jgi:hypothetical protein